MPRLIERLFKRDSVTPPHRRVYAGIVAQARQPGLYASLGVPDTPEGRFEMVVLHAFLVLDRLRLSGPAAAEFAQAVFDEMFRDFDHNLREMGVGDLAVGRRIRRMAEIFYGRVGAYEAALREPQGEIEPALAAVLARTVYDGVPREEEARMLARYAIRQRQDLSQQSLDAVLAGECGFRSSVTKQEARS